jgi:dTDP-4-dehydrorhamnose reductase
MLGFDLRRSAPPDVELMSPPSQAVDITNVHDVTRALDDEAPRWVINAAAYTDVDQAEAHPTLALAVNGDGPGILSTECARRGIPLVHFGTDYVFAGDAIRPYAEDSPVAPLNAYGRSKLAGEQSVLRSGAHALVIRTQWLFGINGRSFPRTMWERACAGIATRVVNDQAGRPSYTVDVASATWELIAREARGVVHVTNTGAPATWFDLAERVFAAAGARELLRPCSTPEYPTPAPRPSYSVLGTRRVEREFSIELPRWEDALQRFLAELGSEPHDTTPAERTSV